LCSPVRPTRRFSLSRESFMRSTFGASASTGISFTTSFPSPNPTRGVFVHIASDAFAGCCERSSECL
jgi:hypothetical protein